MKLNCAGKDRLRERWRAGQPSRVARIYAELKGYTAGGELTDLGRRWLRPGGLLGIAEPKLPGRRRKPKPEPEPERVAVRVVVPPLDDGERWRALRAENMRRSGLWT